MNNKNKKVSLISREGNSESLDFRLLREELESRAIEVEVLTRLFEKKLSLSTISYLGHIAKQVKSINSSNVVILDTYCIPVSMLPHNKDTKVIQMWHALSAIKKFGWQTVGSEDGSSESVARLMKMHKRYDYVLCSSDVTAQYFCEAFKTTPEKIVKLGLPRIDYILRENPEMLARIKNRYPELQENKKTILYAPTFHKGKPVNIQGLIDAIDLNKHNIIVKLHPLDRDTKKIIKRGVVYDNTFNSYDLLKVADAIISDYSSFAVEASLTSKPLYLYVYDEDSYSKTTGLNMNFDEEAISKYVFKDAKNLAQSLEEEYDIDAVKSFRDKYVDVNTDNCTKQLADYIELLLRK